MDKFKKATIASKDFVLRHRTAVAVTTTIVLMAKVNRIAQREQIDFIKAKGLWDEYITPEL